MIVSVVIPTVAGREIDLARCVTAYKRTFDCEIIVVPDLPTCGLAWEQGAAQATGQFLHFTADDLEPHSGWAEAAIETVHVGAIPAPTVYGPGGEVQSSAGHGGPTLYADRAETDLISVVPFCLAEQWKLIGPMGPMAAAHYYTDNWFTWRARRAGLRVVHRVAYAFTHFWAQPGRGAGMSEPERMANDERMFDAARLGETK